MPTHEVFIPEDVCFILNRLCERGYTAHIVGGCVRDMLIGIPPTDYDITTSATPEEVKEVFSELRIIDTGLKHGTVTLLYRGQPYEITTYRTEGAYTDNRHPDSVSFTRNLSLDLSRRDFTVNAMCADKEGRLTDLFGGVGHIEERVISAVGCAKERFTEDALRIMRALRFSATLGFRLDAETAAAVIECRELLDRVSVERIYSELIKLVSGKYAYGVITEYTDIIKKVLPELSEIRLPPSERFALFDGKVRLAALFAVGADTPSGAFSSAMKRLHTDTKTRTLGARALDALCCPTDTEGELLELLYRVGQECAEFTAELKALVYGELGLPDALAAAKSCGRPYKMSDMALGGAQFARAGFVGEKIGRAMEGALCAIMRGEIENTAAEICEYIKTLEL